MARSSCTTCGRQSQHCQCRGEASTTGEGGERAFELTRISFWITYIASIVAAAIVIIFILGGLSLLLAEAVDRSSFFKENTCYLEVFVDSFSVSNASTATATADWNVSFVAETQGLGCKASLNMVQSRLYRGDKLVSEYVTPDYFGKRITGRINEPISYSVFERVVTPIGGVVWDLRVQVVTIVNVRGRSRRSNSDGFLIMNCGDIPVNFTTGMVGDVKGSLIGFKRPCEYLFRKKYWDKSWF